MFMANEPLKPGKRQIQARLPARVAEMFMANEPLKPSASACWWRNQCVAEMFMANEPLKHYHRFVGVLDLVEVAEMFMANEPLKPGGVAAQRVRRRCRDVYGE